MSTLKTKRFDINLKSTLYLPVIIIELYLLSTLLLFKFGPVRWEVENEQTFWGLIFIYHAAFVTGYVFSINKNSKKVLQKPFLSNQSIENFIMNNFWLLSLLILIGSIISYKNSTLSSTYFPSTILSDFYIGLTQPGLARQHFIDSIPTAKGNKLITMILATIVFLKYSLTPFMVIFWENLNFPKRVSSILLFFIPLIATISVGTNKLILDTSFTLSASILVFTLCSRKRPFLDTLRKRKTLIGLALGITLFFPYYFNATMNSRGVNNFKYMESVSKPGNIKIIMDGDSILPNSLHNFLIKVSVYVTQGYYGMSLSTDENFDSTFGVGHSNFLLNQVEYFFNIDLIKRTYQFKIHETWDRLVQWHSFYSQVANDTSFIGVTPVMFFLGWLLSKVYLSALLHENYFAISMLPIFGILFIFIPMNNQIFNFMESLFSLLSLLLLWILSLKLVQNKTQKGSSQ